MNREDLSRAIAKKSGKTIKESAEFIEAFISVVAEAFKNDDRLALTGFATIKPYMRSAGQRILPLTTEPYKYPAKRLIKFRVSKKLIDYINE